MFSALFLLLVAVSTTQAIAKYSGFNPRYWVKASATCPAVKRDANNTAVDIKITYADINPAAKKTIVMVHGWPSLWSSWSYQIMELKKDYRLIIPDLRGFGESTHPDDVKTSGTMYDLAGDLNCILQNAKVANAICMGHDWGSQICYEATRLRPDIFHGVVGIAVPYIPADGPFVAIKDLAHVFPKLRYQLFFDTRTDDAVAELDKDIKRTIRATLRTKASPPPDHYLTSEESFLDAWKHVYEIPPVPFFSEPEEEYFIEQYSIQGFRNTLQFYTTENRRASWEFANKQGNHTIPVPVLAIYPTDDPVADWLQAAELLGSHKFLPLLTVKTVPGGHWGHLESPEIVNSAIRTWLKKLEDDKAKIKPISTAQKIWDEVAGTTRIVEETPTTTAVQASVTSKERNVDEL